MWFKVKEIQKDNIGLLPALPPFSYSSNLFMPLFPLIKTKIWDFIISNDLTISKIFFYLLFQMLFLFLQYWGLHSGPTM
jgi:hypothetical protein